MEIIKKINCANQSTVRYHKQLYDWDEVSGWWAPVKDGSFGRTRIQILDGTIQYH